MLELDLTAPTRREKRDSELTVVKVSREKKRERIEEILLQLIKSENQKIEYGKVFKTIKNVGFEDKNGCQCLKFDDVMKGTDDFDVCKNLTFHSMSQKGENKKFLYCDFKKSIQLVLTEFCDVDMMVSHVGSVHEFLDNNQSRNANLDIIIREKDGVRYVFAHIKRDNDIIQYEVPFFWLDNICENINNEDFAKRMKNERIDMTR